MTNSNLVACKTGRSAGFAPVCGLRALEDLTGVDANLTPHVQIIGPIAHQPTGFDFLANVMGRGSSMARGERHKLDAAADEERVGGHEEGVGALTHEGGESRLDFAAGAGVEDLNLQSNGARSFREVS